MSASVASVERALGQLDENHVVARLSGVGTTYTVTVVPQLAVFVLSGPTGSGVFEVVDGAGADALAAVLELASGIVVAELAAEVGR